MNKYTMLFTVDTNGARNVCIYIHSFAISRGYYDVEDRIM